MVNLRIHSLDESTRSGIPEHLEHRVRMPDGRTVAVAEWGDPAGLPLFVLHGTPESRICVTRSAQRSDRRSRPGEVVKHRRDASCSGNVALALVAVSCLVERTECTLGVAG